jgi:hypothetical protein
MNKQMKTYLLVSSLLLMASNAWSGEAVKLSCLPLTIETYRAVTVDVVRQRSFSKWEINSNEHIIALKEMISAGTPGAFNSDRVRCAIDVGTTSYYVDAAGGVSVAGQPDVHIDIHALQKFIDGLGPGQESGS